MGSILKGIAMLVDEIRKPESYSKGESFEAFVRDTLFPRERYEVLEMTHGYATNKRDFVESSKEPDYLLRDKRTKKCFYVEAKYRSGLYYDKYEWCKPYQMQRYRQISLRTPVYVVLGTGGTSNKPDHKYLFSVTDVHYNSLYPSVLKKYEIKTTNDVARMLKL